MGGRSRSHLESVDRGPARVVAGSLAGSVPPSRPFLAGAVRDALGLVRLIFRVEQERGDFDLDRDKAIVESGEALRDASSTGASVDR